MEITDEEKKQGVVCMPGDGKTVSMEYKGLAIHIFENRDDIFWIFRYNGKDYGSASHKNNGNNYYKYLTHPIIKQHIRETIDGLLEKNGDKE